MNSSVLYDVIWTQTQWLLVKRTSKVDRPSLFSQLILNNAKTKTLTLEQANQNCA